MKTVFFSITVVISVVFFSCLTQESTYVVVNKDEIVVEAGKDLVS